MITCFFCALFCNDNREFLKHILLLHQDEKTFICNDDSCVRRFSNFRSFHKHRFTAHKSKNIRIITDVPTESLKCQPEPTTFEPMECDSNLDPTEYEYNVHNVLFDYESVSLSENLTTEDRNENGTENHIDKEPLLDNVLSDIMPNNIPVFKKKLITFIYQAYGLYPISCRK